VKILIAVCGGIAAYKVAELVRLLRQQAIEIQVIMTASATQFIAPLTFQALSSRAVYTHLLDNTEEQAMGHIQLSRWADKILVAPATANTLAQLSYGFADDLVSAVCLAASCPIYLAPAMNSIMWHKSVTQENIQRLKNQGFTIIDPEAGELACGEIGMGRMADPHQIMQRLLAEPLSSSDPEAHFLQDLHLLITAGPTREPLDPVRYLTNRSSGKMGYALASAAVAAGAKVTLISGPVQLTAPEQVELISVETAEQMYQAVIARVWNYDVYIGAAAVADYAPIQSHSEKIKTKTTEMTITFKRNPDILAKVASLSIRPFVVGFAAETHDLINFAKQKLYQKNLDMIAANWVGGEQGGFDKEENALHVFWQNGEQHFPLMNKKELAKALLKLIKQQMNQRQLDKNIV
jgi:phosphopantothenoylcysteine decarboxylase/phosphopantothenate--cysteine ligase